MMQRKETNLKMRIYIEIVLQAMNRKGRKKYHQITINMNKTMSFKTKPLRCLKHYQTNL